MAVPVALAMGLDGQAARVAHVAKAVVGAKSVSAVVAEVHSIRVGSDARTVRVAEMAKVAAQSVADVVGKGKHVADMAEMATGTGPQAARVALAVLVTDTGSAETLLVVV